METKLANGNHTLSSIFSSDMFFLSVLRCRTLGSPFNLSVWEVLDSCRLQANDFFVVVVYRSSQFTSVLARVVFVFSSALKYSCSVEWIRMRKYHILVHWMKTVERVFSMTETFYKVFKKPCVYRYTPDNVHPSLYLLVDQKIADDHCWCWKLGEKCRRQEKLWHNGTSLKG